MVVALEAKGERRLSCVPARRRPPLGPRGGRTTSHRGRSRCRSLRRPRAPGLHGRPASRRRPTTTSSGRAPAGRRKATSSPLRPLEPARHGVPAQGPPFSAQPPPIRTFGTEERCRGAWRGACGGRRSDSYRSSDQILDVFHGRSASAVDGLARRGQAGALITQGASLAPTPAARPSGKRAGTQECG